MQQCVAARARIGKSVVGEIQLLLDEYWTLVAAHLDLLEKKLTRLSLLCSTLIYCVAFMFMIFHLSEKMLSLGV
jgi:hypothetical protein